MPQLRAETERLRRRHMTGIALTAMLVLAVLGAVTGIMSGLMSVERTLALCLRQAEMTQRIAFQAGLEAHDDLAETWEASRGMIIESLDALQILHERMMAELTDDPSPAMEAIFNAPPDRLDGRTRAFMRAARALTAGSEPARGPVLAEVLNAANNALRAAQFRAVRTLESEAVAARRTLLRVAAGGGIAILLALTLIAVMAQRGVERLYETFSSHLRFREKEADESLEAALDSARARSRNVAVFGEELRAPLGAAIAAAKLLARTPLGDNQQRILRVVRASCGGPLERINDMLDVARLENGVATLACLPFAPDVLIAESLERRRAGAREKGVELIEESGEGAGVEMVGDAARLQTVLRNIIDYAIAGTERAQIRLSWRLLPAERAARPTPGAVEGDFALEVTVRDSGPDRTGASAPGGDEERTGAASGRPRSGEIAPAMALCTNLCRQMGGWLDVETGTNTGFDCRFAIVVKAPSHACAAAAMDATGS